MKLQFKHQPFQAEAAAAVCDVFRGQSLCAQAHRQGLGAAADRPLSLAGTGTGLCNQPLAPELTDARILKNLHAVQRRVGLPSVRPGRAGDQPVRGDGDRHRQDLYLCENHLRAKRPLRLEPVHHRGSVGGRPGGRLPFPCRRPRSTSPGSTAGGCGFSSTTPTASPRWTASPPTAPFRS